MFQGMKEDYFYHFGNILVLFLKDDNG